MTDRMPTAAAREFVAHCKQGHRWDHLTLDRFLRPYGWRLDYHAVDSDFHPVTIAHVTRAYRAHARRDEDATA